MKLIGEQRALSFDIWPDPTIGSVTGYYCVFFVSIQCFKLCLTIVHPISRYSKITVTTSQCSMFTYSYTLTAINKCM